MTTDEVKKLKRGDSVQFFSCELSGLRWIPGVVESVTNSGKYVSLLTLNGTVVQRPNDRVRRPQS